MPDADEKLTPADPPDIADAVAFALRRRKRVYQADEHMAGQSIITSLRRDGYSASQIEGPLLKRQLADLIKATGVGGPPGAA